MCVSTRPSTSKTRLVSSSFSHYSLLELTVPFIFRAFNSHRIVRRDVTKLEIFLLCPSLPSSLINLIDFGIAQRLSLADAESTPRYNLIENNTNTVGSLNWCSI